MSQPDAGQRTSPDASSWAPSRPALVAAVVFVLAALTLCWPMLGGRFLLGDDQLFAGYAFRSWSAEMVRRTGHIPEWNPYIFGGMPFIAALHGDIFYPSAWLRWILPTDTAMNLSFAVHFVIAGCAMYAFLRALRLSWTAALIGGLAYELSGIVTSLMRPGHDGKLFVSALAPLAFLALLRAIRYGRPQGFALFALVVGLCIVSPQTQMAYYLLVASAIWTLYLVFFDPERPPTLRWPVALGAALGAVVLGVAIAGIQVLPFLSYLPFSPRGVGGPSTGWEYATQFAMPVEELFTTVLPQFNGIQQHYWGSNHFKSHTEYLGAVVVLLAALGLGDRARGRLRWGLGAIGLLFLLVAFGGHTPFYRLWYEVMPMMKKVRAAGMAFYLVALVTAVYAAFGVDRVLRGGVRPKTLLIAAGVLTGVALLGAAGVLQSVAETLAQPELADQVAANSDQLQLGALRLLLVALAGGGVVWAIARGRLRGAAAAAALGLVVGIDLWSIDHLFFNYTAPARQIFAPDPITSRIRAKGHPYRVMDIPPPGSCCYVYKGSVLMAEEIQQVFGYHGNEVRFYDELWGGKNVWANAGNLGLWDLFAVQAVVLPEQQSVPGYHLAAGPVTLTTELARQPGAPVYLYERDTAAAYARVVASAAKVPDSLTVPTVVDPRFPLHDVVLFSDTASVSPTRLQAGQLPPRSAVRASVAAWAPGQMRIALDGADTRPTYLLVSETWYPDWHATVDGRDAPVLRGDHALIAVPLAPGAREVRLRFHSKAYDTGKALTALAVVLTFGLLALPRLRRARPSSVSG